MLAATVAFAMPVAFATITDKPREFPLSEEATWMYEGVKLSAPVDEAIVSWNVKHGENAAVFVEIRARDAEATSGWMPVARWTLDETRADRTSVESPSDPWAKIDTDTLVLKRPAFTFDLRLTVRRLGEGAVPSLTLLTLAGSRGKPQSAAVAPLRAFAPLPVPERAQGDYPNGGVLCSPTSLSMVLNHAGIPLDMPEVQQAVYDPEYGGTGNWAFNVAYAGSRPELSSVVARFAESRDLEPWLRSGVPVILSVSLDLLKGKEKDNGGGHLVVLVGFDANGDPIMNDPAWRGAVRRTYRRADFERAWAFSKHTVYLVWRSGQDVPVL